MNATFEFSNRFVVIFIMYVALSRSYVAFAADEERLSIKNLEAIAARIVEGGDNPSPAERKEILDLALRQDTSADHEITLLKTHFLSISRASDRGAEILKSANEIEAHLKDVGSIDVWSSYISILVFAFEDKEAGASNEERWFKEIARAAPDKQSAFFDAVSNTKWILAGERLKRLMAAYESAEIAQSARESIIDVILAGAISGGLDVPDACLFYRDVCTSQWTSPALNRKMFSNLGEMAEVSRFIKAHKK